MVKCDACKGRNCWTLSGAGGLQVVGCGSRPFEFLTRVISSDCPKNLLPSRPTAASACPRRANSTVHQYLSKEPSLPVMGLGSLMAALHIEDAIGQPVEQRHGDDLAGDASVRAGTKRSDSHLICVEVIHQHPHHGMFPLRHRQPLDQKLTALPRLDVHHT